MATTAGGTPYVESSDLVADYPTISLALAEHIDDLPSAVLQIVRATDTTQRSTNSTSFVDVTGMSVTITPQKSTSAIILMAVFSGSTQTSTSGDHRVSYQLTTSSDVGVNGSELMLSGNENYSISGTAQTDKPITLIGYATPATTSAVTYKLRFNVASSNTTNRIRNELNTGQMYAIEVSA